MVHPKVTPSPGHEGSTALQNADTSSTTRASSLVGRFYTFIKTASISLKDTIDSSEDVFINDDTDRAPPADEPSIDYETDVEKHEGLYQPCDRETTPRVSLSDVRALKDQLEKLLSDEAPLETASPAESPSLRLYLGNLVDNGYGIMVPVAPDLTPLLSSEQGFLYYAVDDSETRGAPLRSPAAVMASSIAVRLEALELSQSVSLSTEEQLTLSKLRKLASLFGQAKTDHLLNQGASIQQLRRMWTIADSLAARAAEKSRKTEQKSLSAQPRAHSPEASLGTTVSSSDQMMNVPRLPGPDFNDTELEEVTSEASELAREDLCQVDVWVRQKSRFDAHLPAELRCARTLVADIIVLEYGVNILLCYDNWLTDAQQSYLWNVLRSIDHAWEGKSPLADRRFRGHRDKIWDVCWSVYFDLTEHMFEEVENFLGQLFHGRTSDCSYDKIVSLQQKLVKSKSVTKEAPAVTNEDCEESSTNSDCGSRIPM